MRLTDLTMGGGCGCKIAPGHLKQLLGGAPDRSEPLPWLLVGREGNEDSAAFRIRDGQVALTSLDFFPPIVDDPLLWGRIASCNAISDIYAMGGEPLLATAILGFPTDKLDDDVIRKVLDGARSACTEAGIPIAGGHSINLSEPIFGLSVIGQVEARRMLRNSTSRPGDVIALTKPIGVGLVVSAIKDRIARFEETSPHYAAAMGIVTTLNSFGAIVSGVEGVSAMTDVTGFGLIGHLHEMALGAGTTARVVISEIPLMAAAVGLAESGRQTGGAKRNYAHYGADVSASPTIPEWKLRLLCDPQTNGGLLITVAADALPAVSSLAQRQGQALFVIGEMHERGERPIIIAA